MVNMVNILSAEKDNLYFVSIMELKELSKTYETKNYEFATLHRIITVTYHKPVLTIGGST